MELHDQGQQLGGGGVLGAPSEPLQVQQARLDGSLPGLMQQHFS